MTEIITRKYHSALWRIGPDGKYRMTDVYAELFQQYLVGELSQQRFMERTDEIQAIHDGLREPF
jgi:hypothetical protein